jgi:hypothetical protein
MRTCTRLVLGARPGSGFPGVPDRVQDDMGDAAGLVVVPVAVVSHVPMPIVQVVRVFPVRHRHVATVLSVLVGVALVRHVLSVPAFVHMVAVDAVNVDAAAGCRSSSHATAGHRGGQPRGAVGGGGWITSDRNGYHFQECRNVPVEAPCSTPRFPSAISPG